MTHNHCRCTFTNYANHSRSDNKWGGSESDRYADNQAWIVDVMSEHLLAAGSSLRAYSRHEATG